ncbi:N-methyltransferase [Sulfuricella sp. T08]|uniref:prepilin peptidase n=1 Tax=Sulfuricella sp. T08 TaxID=1632857 RepID=UPI0006179F53|nr:A24 family peptidase [Sulfuricella sp. T08]GAO37086.1 N-methyltransferase [Sulfuricella sp. T08]
MIFEPLQSSPALYVSVAALLGLMVGSFLNVVIHRVPRMMEREWREQCNTLDGEEAAPATPYNLVVPRSACPSCGHMISAWENVPLISWLILRGRCAHCKTPISPRYPIVEALTGIISGYVAWRFGFGPTALAAMLFTWALIALTFIDFDTQLLPDSITQPLIWLGLLLNLNGFFTGLDSALVGAVAGYLSLWSVYWLFKLVTKKEGMGYGDFKLLAAIGAWLGWQMLPLVILLSSLVGATVGLSLILFAGHGRQIPIPFGPYLAGGGLIALLWGKQITQAYLGL